jgi:hypothetical protein
LYDLPTNIFMRFFIKGVAPASLTKQTNNIVFTQAQTLVQSIFSQAKPQLLTKQTTPRKEITTGNNNRSSALKTFQHAFHPTVEPIQRRS